MDRVMLASCNHSIQLFLVSTILWRMRLLRTKECYSQSRIALWCLEIALMMQILLQKWNAVHPLPYQQWHQEAIRQSKASSMLKNSRKPSCKRKNNSPISRSLTTNGKASTVGKTVCRRCKRTLRCRSSTSSRQRPPNLSIHSKRTSIPASTSCR